MFLLFDENVPYKFVQGLALLEEANHKSNIKVTITHPKGLNLQGASDEDLIKYAGGKDGVIISFDKDFRHMKSYYPLYKEHKVGVIVLHLPKKQSNYWGIVSLIIKHWEEIKSKLKTAQKPFIFELTSKGLEIRDF